MKINEVQKIQISDEVIDAHSGQIDARLSIFHDGESMGYLEYTVFEGQPSISMVEVFHKGEKYATRLVKELQKRFPDTEIDWGVTTEEGEALRKSLSYKKVQTEYYKDFKEYSYVKERIKELKKKVEPYWNKKNLDDKDRKKVLALTDELNDLHDKEFELEELLYDKKPYKYIINTESTS